MDHPTQIPPGYSWRRNQFAVTATSFIGYTGFTLVMPFLPLYIAQMGVGDMGVAAMWAGLSIGVTPAVTAVLQPFWGRIADRYGRKLMVERALASFVIIMSAMAYATEPWHVFALRAVQGLFAGYGALTLAMAAESAPRERMASAIGLVQTAQRLGPALGPVIGGAIAALVGLRRAFFVTAGFYASALVLVLVMYREPRGRRVPGSGAPPLQPSFGEILGLLNFKWLLVAIFFAQFVDRSFGPILPLHVAALGVPDARIAFVAGVLFSVLAGGGALGHHVCGRLMDRYPSRVVITGGLWLAAAAIALFLVAGQLPLVALSLAAFGLGVGVSMTGSFTAAGLVIPDGAQGTAFGILSGASLAGIALSPAIAGLLSTTRLDVVFLLDLAIVIVLAAVLQRGLKTQGSRLEGLPGAGAD